METLLAMLNMLDLALLAFLLFSLLCGASRGLIRTIFGTLGNAAVLIGATILARVCAPILSAMLVEPILGDLFAYDLSVYTATLPVGEQIAQTASSMSEGVAFLILFFVFMIALGIVMAAVSGVFSLATRFPPLGFLDRLGGAALGVVLGAILAIIVVHVAHLFQPTLFQPLGVLAPERIESTVLLSRLLEFFPL